MQVQTEVLYTANDTQLVSAIEQKMSRLERFFSRFNEARVFLKFDNCRHTKSRIAEIKVLLPNGIIFIKEGSKTFDMALDKALVALKIQLLKRKSEQLQPVFTQ